MGWGVVGRGRGGGGVGVGRIKGSPRAQWQQLTQFGRVKLSQWC